MKYQDFKSTFIKPQQYRKFAIDRPGGIQFLATHNFWATHFRIIIKIYSDRKICILSEYNYIIVLRSVVQKLYVAKNCIPPGLSIANLWYLKMIFCCCYLFELIIGKLCLSHRQNKFLQKKIEKKAWFVTKFFFFIS